MTIPICVNRKLLRMKSTAKQETNRNFEKNSFFSLICSGSSPRGLQQLQAKTWHWHVFFLTDFVLIFKQRYPIFSAFLDASKAFDGTTHNLLFAKLIKRNVSVCIVRQLLSWYRQQTMQVKLCTNYPTPYTVTNGVRQGGILVLYVFAVYLELSIQLGSCSVGSTVGNMVVNHLMFADDICVFSPSISGLQCLRNICGECAAEHEITFNCIKTIGPCWETICIDFSTMRIFIPVWIPCQAHARFFFLIFIVAWQKINQFTCRASANTVTLHSFFHS